MKNVSGAGRVNRVHDDTRNFDDLVFPHRRCAFFPPGDRHEVMSYDSCKKENGVLFRKSGNRKLPPMEGADRSYATTPGILTPCGANGARTPLKSDLAEPTGTPEEKRIQKRSTSAANVVAIEPDR